jgi:hypothetical protein
MLFEFRLNGTHQLLPDKQQRNREKQEKNVGKSHRNLFYSISTFFYFTGESFNKYNSAVAEKNGVSFFPWLCSM